MNSAIRFMEALLTAAVGVVGALLLAPYVLAPPASVQIMTIDANALIQSFVTQDKLEQDPETFEADLRAWEKRLGEVTAAFAAENGVIVVNSTAVLGGGTDVTALLIERMKE